MSSVRIVDGNRNVVDKFGRMSKAPGGRLKEFVGTGEYLRGNLNFLRNYQGEKDVIDPFLSVFADDPVIEELKIDVADIAARTWAKQKRAMVNSIVLSACLEAICLPLSLPLALGLQNSLENSIRATASKTHLVLRQSSLLFRLDSHSRFGYSNNPPLWMESNHQVHGLEFALSLDEAELELLGTNEPGWVTCENTMDYDKFYVIPTLLIKAKGVVVAEIDGPADAQAFLEKFNEAKAKYSGKTIASSIQADHDKVLCDLFFTRSAEEQQRIRVLQAQIKASGSSGGAPMAIPVMERDEEEDVPTILRSIGLPANYVEIFESQKITRSFLLCMDEDTLKELGVDSSLERKRITAWVQQSGK